MDVSAQVPRLSAGRLPSPLGEVSLFPLMASTNWTRGTQIMEENLLFSKSVDFNVTLT